MTKICILLPNLSCGGAERLSINLAHEWANRGYEVEFALMREEGEFLPLVGSEIGIVGLGASRIRDVIQPLRGYLRKNKPDVLLAGMWPLTSASVIAWLLSGRQGKLFLTDHVHLRLAAIRELKVSSLYLAATVRATYRFATGTMGVSGGVAEDVRTLAGFAPGKVRVIYNPVSTNVPQPRASVTDRERLWGGGFNFHILSVGTLKTQKNHALLIRAFAALPHRLNAKLVIIGEGELRSELEALVRELDLQDCVSLPGFSNDPNAWFRSSDLFVLSSDWEGFGNVIVEALECGIPVVSTNCQSGPAEILEDGRYGTLVPVGDAIALTKAMTENLSHTHDSDALRQRARDFAVDQIAEEYLHMFELPTHTISDAQPEL